ncbi:CAP domain-containing protein [Mesobacillus boroniphilus]|nr:CAP domain-containing protein [Mesobacillus boroniphilus]
MSIYKHGKIITLSAVMLLGLAACNNNNDEAMDLRDNRMTTLGNDRTGYWDNDANRMKQQKRRAEINAAKRNTLNGEDATSEIMQMPNGKGFITIDPNSYSTGIPSSKYPHMEMNKGRLKLTEEQQADLDKMLAELQRRTGVDIPELNQGAAPAPAPNQGAAPAPAPTPRAVPAPDKDTVPAPEQGAAPAPEREAAPAPTQEAAPAPEQKATPTGTEISAFEARVIDLTNEQRRKNGLGNLQPDTALSNVAQEKSNDMQAKNYFSHTSPTYGSPFDMMRDFGVSYKSAGENIAMGQRSAEEVVNAWMNSEGHRKNILSPNFTHIGVGHTSEGNYWTQMFISK